MIAAGITTNSTKDTSDASARRLYDITQFNRKKKYELRAVCIQLHIRSSKLGAKKLETDTRPVSVIALPEAVLAQYEDTDLFARSVQGNIFPR